VGNTIPNPLDGIVPEAHPHDDDLDAVAVALNEAAVAVR
jgi:hypothetical protein